MVSNIHWKIIQHLLFQFYWSWQIRKFSENIKVCWGTKSYNLRLTFFRRQTPHWFAWSHLLMIMSYYPLLMLNGGSKLITLEQQSTITDSTKWPCRTWGRPVSVQCVSSHQPRLSPPAAREKTSSLTPETGPRTTVGDWSRAWASQTLIALMNFIISF